jgi:hypothetical protein
VDKLADTLRSQGSISRTTLEHRKQIGSLSKRETHSLKEHIKYCKWESLPNSPTNFALLPEPTSPGCRSHWNQDELDHQEFSTLVRSDRRLHKIFNDVNGLRVWWVKNRQEWLEQRNLLIAVERNLEGIKQQKKILADQANYGGFVTGSAELKYYRAYQDRIKVQTEMEEKNCEELTKWMVDNRRLMSKVVCIPPLRHRSLLRMFQTAI